jgi:hypothetical protein
VDRQELDKLRALIQRLDEIAVEAEEIRSRLARAAPDRPADPPGPEPYTDGSLPYSAPTGPYRRTDRDRKPGD